MDSKGARSPSAAIHPANATASPSESGVPVTTVAFTQPAGETTQELMTPEAVELAIPTVVAVTNDTPLTLSEANGLAYQNNPTLALAAARMAAAEGRQVQAGLYPNPVVGYHGTEIGNQGTSGGQGGFVAQKLVTGGKLRLAQAAGARAVQSAHFRLHAQEQRVLTDVRIRFYEALAAQRRVELAAELTRIGDDLVATTEKLLEGRLRTENDLLQAQIRAEEAHILRDNSENELREAWRRLTVVIGVPSLQGGRLDGDLDREVPELSWEECCNVVLAQNPALQATRARAAQARILVERARREPIPNVDVFVSVRHQEPTDSNVANVQVGVPVPVFDRNQGNIRAAEADWVAASQEIERIELQLQDQLAVAYRRYRNARRQAARYRQSIIPKAERSLRLVSGAYDLGQVEYLTLLIAQQTYVQTTLANVDSLRELQTAAAVIEGQLLSGSLSNSDESP
jgi:outer membrane protein, heavy metal efflux system